MHPQVKFFPAQVDDNNGQRFADYQCANGLKSRPTSGTYNTRMSVSHLSNIDSSPLKLGPRRFLAEINHLLEAAYGMLAVQRWLPSPLKDRNVHGHSTHQTKPTERENLIVCIFLICTSCSRYLRATLDYTVLAFLHSFVSCFVRFPLLLFFS
jgi:hypothetical protein